ncbi:MAG: hypothetical protein GX075_11675 [Firmicutes bacterium]|nr:hypothetical protein [Bacillota bacterium]
MKRISIILFCILLLSGGVYYIKAQSGSQLSSKNNLRTEDFKIMNIYLGQPISEALSVLGQPIKVVNGEELSECNKYYYFPNIMIGEHTFHAGKVGYILVSKSGIKTFRGIEVGSSEKDIIDRYGSKKKYHDSLSYGENKENALFANLISFIIDKNGKVKEILIQYASTL